MGFCNVLNSCKKFYEILYGKRTSTLFPLVLPTLIKYLEIPDILSIRLVNEQWKDCVDKPLQLYSTTPESFEGHWWHSDSPFAKFHGHLDRRFFLDDVNEIVKLSEKFEQSHGTGTTQKNPFVSRSATFKFGTGAQFQLSLDKVLATVTKFGSHIWDFTQFCPSIAGVEDLSVSSLPSLLERLENLRSLKIDWNTHEVIRVTQDVLSALRVAQFPALPHLQSLNFDLRGGGELEGVLGLALLRSYGHQLTTLICRGDFLGVSSLTPELLISLLPKIENLRVFSVSTQALLKLIAVQNRTGGQWSLKRLQLWYSFRNLEFRTVIRAINTFSGTLTQLHLDIKLDFPFQWSNEHLITPEEMNVHHPEMRKLSAPVSCVNSPWFWEFVKIKFTNLERLDLQTAMESLFAPYQRKYLKREIQQAKRFFNFLPKLQKIMFWFHNDGNMVIYRQPAS